MIDEEERNDYDSGGEEGDVTKPIPPPDVRPDLWDDWDGPVLPLRPPAEAIRIPDDVVRRLGIGGS